MTWAILAVMSLLLSGAQQHILTPKMDKVLTRMERVYEKQWVNPMTTWCENVDSSVGTGEVILVWECPKNVEFYVVFDLVNKKWFRVRNYKDTVFNLLN